MKLELKYFGECGARALVTQELEVNRTRGSELLRITVRKESIDDDEEKEVEVCLDRDELMCLVGLLREHLDRWGEKR